MKILSCNTGAPQEYELNGVKFKTSMVRHPQKQIQVTTLRVLGDAFAGPHIHGTEEAVVYALSADRYDKDWTDFLGRKAAYGLFGENLTVDLLREEDFKIDDIWTVGTTVLKVTGPRYPCNRLNFVTGNPDMRDTFAARAWPGVYFRVIQEGVVTAGDTLQLQSRTQDQLSVKDVYLAMYAAEKKAPRGPEVDRVLGYTPLWFRYRDKVKAVYN